MIPREELLRIRRIASKANPRVKEWASLGDRKERDSLRLTVAEGARLAGEGLRPDSPAGLRPVSFLVSDSGAGRPEAGDLFARAERLGVERVSLSDECFVKLSGLKNADGLALVLSFERSLPDFTALGGSGARWLVAAGVQDPGNAGALARTALATGCDACLFLDGADPVSPKFLRGSMGAAFAMPCMAMAAGDFIAAWKDAGVPLIMAASGGDAEDYRRLDYSPPMALLVGGERGVPDELAVLADRRAHIPLAGGVESLNLAVAAGVILFEAGRAQGGMRPVSAEDAREGGTF